MNDENLADDNDARYPIPDGYFIKDRVFTSLRLFRIERVGEKTTRVGIHMRLNPATVGWADVHEHCGGGEYIAQPVNEKGHVKGSYTQSLAGESIPAERIFWPAHLVLPGSPRVAGVAAGDTPREIAPAPPGSPEPPAIRLERERMLLHEERLFREREWQDRQAERDREERRLREERERMWMELTAKREAEERRWREERDERERRWREERDERERRWAEEREERRRTAELEREERIQRAAVERVKIEQEAMLQREKLRNEHHQSGIQQFASVAERVVSSVMTKHPELLERIADRLYGKQASEHAAAMVRQQIRTLMPELAGNLTDAALDEIARRPDILAKIGRG